MEARGPPTCGSGIDARGAAARKVSSCRRARPIFGQQPEPLCNFQGFSVESRMQLRRTSPALEVQQTEKAIEPIIGCRLIAASVKKLVAHFGDAKIVGVRLLKCHPASLNVPAVNDPSITRVLRRPQADALSERKFACTYNARRDSLRKSWGKVFGYTHGVILAQAFYEHVDQDGEDVVLELRPQTARR